MSCDCDDNDGCAGILVGGFVLAMILWLISAW